MLFCRCVSLYPSQCETCPVNPPNSRDLLPASKEGYQTSLVPPPNIFGPWSATREFLPASRSVHRLPEAFTGLVPVNLSPTALFVVETINRPPPTPLDRFGHSEKAKLSLRSNLEILSLSLSLRSKPWILVPERRFGHPLEWVAQFKQEHFTLSLDDLDCVC
jgi:hypothetical protein